MVIDNRSQLSCWSVHSSLSITCLVFSVVDPHWLQMDPAFYLNADPDPGNKIDADPDPGSETITDTIPDPGHP